VTVGLFFLVALSGCLDAQTDPEGPKQAPGERNWGDVVLEDLEGGTPDVWDADLQAPPEWRLGQWWQVRVTDHLSGGVHETTVVVAGAERDWFLTGMPADDFLHSLMVLHLPGIGQVAKDTLGWDVHDEVFHVLQFPLREGDTWDTHWSAAPVQADVVSVSGNRAEVEFVGNSAHFKVVYDADVGTIVSMDIPGYAQMEVIDHGFEYEGVVTVPHQHDLIFFHGRLAGAVGVGVQDTGPHAPVETITVSGDYDRVSFALLVFALAPGFYAAEATAPDGSRYETQFVATEPDQINIQIHSNDDPVGDWEVLFLAGGAGAVAIEGIGYHVFDIELPSGCLVAAMDEHAHHGAEHHSQGC
jgi:hypothetical protein